MSPGTLLIRADANVAMGSGHVMRCLALAQAWQDEGGDAILAMAESTQAVLERLRRENVPAVHLGLVDAAAEIEQIGALACKHGAPWVVVDGYQFDADYHRRLKRAGLKVLLVDDLGRPIHYSADLVLNQNAYAEESLYRSREPGTMLMLGTRYVLLRREFIASVRGEREIPDVAHKVLVTMGGSDPGNGTLKVVHALAILLNDGIEARVVAGGSNPHWEMLEKTVRPHQPRMQLLRDVMDMSEWMGWADLAIANAGTVCWELCRLGVPAMVADLAENQRPVAQALETRGAAVYVRNLSARPAADIALEIRSLVNNQGERLKLSQNASRMVDGKGSARVVLTMRGCELGLRRVREEDKDVLWKWANDPEVRASSFSTADIPWTEHEAWFAAKLRDESTNMFIASDRNGSLIGQIRFDLIGRTEAEIDVSVAREHRRKGYAALLINNAVQTAFSASELRRLHAYVKPGNEASMRAFERAEFERGPDVEVHGIAALHYVRERGW